MLCQTCGSADAVVKLTKIVGGAKERVHLCRPCAESHGFLVEPSVPVGTMPFPFPMGMDQLIGPVIDALAASVQAATPAARETVCEECGITPAEFKKRGRLGCPNDYVAFEEELDRLFRKIHGKSTHVGRSPARFKAKAGMARLLKERVEVLRKELDTAVKTENYEVAARLRDRLRDLEKSSDDADS